jgi:hypothetical protein
MRGATLFLCLSLSGCGPLADLVLDCIDDDQPELSPSTLPNPILNQVYNQVIHVGIRNEPYDDRFDYTFTLSGNIPTGMQIEVLGRDFRLIGTPTELGDFGFTVRVDVEGNNITNDTTGLCSTTDSQSYRWTVQMM